MLRVAAAWWEYYALYTYIYTLYMFIIAIVYNVL